MFAGDGGTSRTCLKKCRHDFGLMGKCVVPSGAQTKIKTDCCCYRSREQDDYDAEIGKESSLAPIMMHTYLNN